MFKSFCNRRFLPLAVLSAALCSMTLAAAPVGARQGGNGGPEIDVVGNTSDKVMTAVGPGQSEPLITEELVDLVAPVALYPDDLLAIVLPAAAYPLQIVQAARFLEQLEKDDSLQPDEDWDESVVALLNYPEVVDLLNNDLKWTWQLGEAVINQEPEVIAAIETFRDRAVLAGNLETDEHQIVNNEDGAIKITPVEREVIYVPYYEPERVVVYQPYPVYNYYPDPYPVYYYPYPADYYFSSGFFWGITTAFTIGWYSHHLNVHYSNYYSHPYYGYTYFQNHHYYHGPSHHDTGHQQVRGGRHDGDRWQPGPRHGARPNRRGQNNDRHEDNRVIATSGGSGFQRPGTFRPRPGFQGQMISAGNTGSDGADRRTGRPPALSSSATKPTRREMNRKYFATPKMDDVSPNRQTSGKAKRNRLDYEPDRRDINSRLVAQNRSGGNRLNRLARSQDRVALRTVPSNRDRQVSRSDRNKPIRTSRPEPVTSMPPRARVTNALAYSGSRMTRPTPQPRQSRRSASRAPATRAAPPAASKPSASPRFDRGRSNSNGSRGPGPGRRAGRVRRQ